MTVAGPLSGAFDRLAAAAAAALAGSIIVSVLSGWVLGLPLVAMVGCVLAIPSMLILTVLTEAAARVAPRWHDSFLLWMVAGFVAAGPLLWLAPRFGSPPRFDFAMPIEVACLIAPFVAWLVYVRREERLW